MITDRGFKEKIADGREREQLVMTGERDNIPCDLKLKFDFSVMKRGGLFLYPERKEVDRIGWGFIRYREGEGYWVRNKERERLRVFSRKEKK